MSDDIIQTVRERLAARQRLNLTQAEALLTRLDQAEAEIERLKVALDAVTVDQTSSAPPVEQTTTLPEPFSPALARFVTPDTLEDAPDEILAVVAWYTAWQKIRNDLTSLVEKERDMNAALDWLEGELDVVYQRVLALTEQQSQEEQPGSQSEDAQ